MAYSHIAIVVDDIDESEAFYRNVFGFSAATGRFHGSGTELARLMGTDNARIEGLFMSCGGLVIELLHYVDVVSSVAGGRDPSQLGYAHLSFVVDSVSDRMSLASKWGGSARLESRTEIRFGPGAAVVMGFVADPDGNQIELIEHPDDDAARDHARFLKADSIGWPPPA